jgi:phage-related protein
MPETEVIIFADDDKQSPLINWMEFLKQKVVAKCIAKIQGLKEMGYELKRPEADILRDGIYELRIKHERVPYRILYFFHNHKAIISHGIQKKDIVPSKEIDRATNNKRIFIENPELHTYEEEVEE